MPETQTHTVIANKERCLHSPQTPREIWFVRFLGIYFPCHWKGIAAMAAVIIPSVIAIMLGEKALAAPWLSRSRLAGISGVLVAGDYLADGDCQTPLLMACQRACSTLSRAA